MKVLLLSLFALIVSGVNASNITLTVANYPQGDAMLLFINYKTMLMDTLVNFKLKEGRAVQTVVVLPRSGFYNLVVGKHSIPVHLEKEENHEINVDFATYPKGFSLNGKSQLNELLYQMNNDWMYLKDQADAATQLQQINAYAERYAMVIKNSPKLTNKETGLLNILLDGIVSIMKTNAATIFSNTGGTTPPFYKHLEGFKIDSDLHYEAFPEKFLRAKLYNAFTVKYGTSPQSAPEKYLDYLSEMVSDQACREFLSAHFISSAIRMSEKNETDALVELLKTKVTSDELLQNATKTVKTIYKRDFVLPSLDLVGTDLKKAPISMFKGKLVLIDVWALWCGPCLQEGPYMEKLATHYKNEPRLAVLQVSIDQDKSEWLKAVEKATTKHYWAEGGFNTPFSKALEIKSIPRFILIDGNGIVIEPDAPRPSDKALYTLIDAALAKMKQ